MAFSSDSRLICTPFLRLENQIGATAHYCSKLSCSPGGPIMAAPLLPAVLRHIHQVTGSTSVADRTDTQLLEQFVQLHDEAAFEALLGRHGPLVWRVCCRLLRRSHDAEEAFQNTFVVLAQSAASIRK